jgi:hypothetical protein
LCEASLTAGGNYLSARTFAVPGRFMWIKIIRLQHHAHMEHQICIRASGPGNCESISQISKHRQKSVDSDACEFFRVCRAERLECSTLISRKNLSVNYEFFSGGNR